MRSGNQDFMDALAIVSFIVGVANYNENLTQSDKDDIMKRLDKQTVDILQRLQAAIDDQNEMLHEILSILKGGNGNDKF